MLQRSDAHVYLSYPFVASWSLREALATGCVVIGGDTPTVSEFVRHEKNGLLVPFFDPKGLACAVLQALEDAPLSRRLRDGARRYAVQELAMRDYMARYEALIGQLTGHVTASALGSAARPTCRLDDVCNAGAILML